jgi:hypothetical protein
MTAVDTGLFFSLICSASDSDLLFFLLGEGHFFLTPRIAHTLDLIEGAYRSEAAIVIDGDGDPANYHDGWKKPQSVSVLEDARAPRRLRRIDGRSSLREMGRPDAFRIATRKAFLLWPAECATARGSPPKRQMNNMRRRRRQIQR